MLGFDEYDDENAYVMEYNKNTVLTQTFFRMFLGLLATGLVAFYLYSTGMYINLFANDMHKIIWVAEFAVVIIFSLLFRNLSPGVVTFLFFVYAILNGVTLSTIFAYFELSSIIYTFFITAAIFGGLAYLGKTTKKDLSSFGTILTVTLLFGIILTIMNFIIQSTMFDIALNWLILLIFMGFTVYDINKLNVLISKYNYENQDKLSTYVAMDLYLDFINIFLRILLTFGKSRD